MKLKKETEKNIDFKARTYAHQLLANKVKDINDLKKDKKDLKILYGIAYNQLQEKEKETDDYKEEIRMLKLIEKDLIETVRDQAEIIDKINHLEEAKTD